MKLSSLISPSLVIQKPADRTEESIITNMVNQMCKVYNFELRKDKVVEALREREKLGKTILSGGIMLPHARFEALNDLIIAVTVLPEPMTIDGKEIRIIFLILTGLSKSNMYLNTLAALAQIAKKPGFIEELVRQQTPEDFLKSLDKAEILIKKELNVSNIMMADAPSVHPETSLKEAVDLLSAHNTGYLPVTDQNGRFLAEVSVFEILAKGIPNYANMLTNLSFLNQFEPFEDLLLNETTHKIRDIMKKPKSTLPPDASIVEAAFEMIQHYRRHISVVDKTGKFLGVISYMEIINKVIRG
jgi:mannitol/fructose-specific phosphotransferase system IIA component (Ntr-type)/CBS domain-containing protein